MQSLFAPVASGLALQLEDGTVGVSAAIVGRSVEIAGGIDDQAGVGGISVLAIVVEAVQNLLAPASVGLGRQLEDHTVIVSAARGRHAVEIAGAIEGHASVGVVAVVAAVVEAVQGLLGPAAVRHRRQREHRAPIVNATSGDGCIESPGWTRES